MRTWLTIIGIVIGVTAVVLIIAISNGLQANVQRQLGGLGADVVSLSAGFSRAGSNFGFRGPEGGQGGSSTTIANNLTTKDIQSVKGVPNIQYVTGTISGRTQVDYSGQSSNAQVTGIDVLSYRPFATYTIAFGRDLAPSDSDAVLLGDRLANQVFKRPITTGTIIQIGGKPFRVAGILAASGGGFGGGGGDNAIFMPIAKARTILGEFTPDQLSSISMKMADASLLNETLTALTQRLTITRQVVGKTQDFTLTAAQSLRDQVASVTSTLALFLGGIAAISLLVGAIGIANTMFMAVLERTKQIGVLKALGASKGEVTRLFLIEAGILGFSGGAIGIALSLLVSLVLTEAGIGITLPTAGAGGRGGGGSGLVLITPELIFFALAFSTIIGMIAGYVPSKQAASLKPVDALKYE